MTCLANAAQLALWQLFFNGTRWPGIAQNDALAGLTQFYISLHNQNPTEGGSQNNFETAYPNYARVAVARVAGQWNVVGTNPVAAYNLNPITFPQCGGGIDTLNYWGLGSAASGPGTLFLSAPIALTSVAPLGFTADANGNLTVPGNTLTVNQQVSLYSLEPAFTLPSGLSETIQYYVGTIAGSLVTLSTTLNNANPVPTVTPGAGILIPALPLLLVINQTVPSFPANGLVAYLN